MLSESNGELIINGNMFKRIDDIYYIDAYGNMYSRVINSYMRHEITHSGHHRVQLHGRHYFVHRLVYLLWVGPLIPGLQINHIDDNKENNHFSNLYQGTQQENIQDCIRNDHRVGNKREVLIYDRAVGYMLKFYQIRDLIAYSGHSCANGNINKIASKKWFKERFVFFGRYDYLNDPSYSSYI